MHRPLRTDRLPAAASRLAVPAAVLLIPLVLAAALLASPACAQPEREQARMAPPVGLAVSLESSAPAIAPDGTFGYTAQIRAGEPVSSLRVRFRIFRADGGLLYERNRYESELSSGAVTSYSWSRDLGEPPIDGLRPGAYPVRLDISAVMAGGRSEQTIATELRVFDPDLPAEDVALIAHVSAPPMTDPAGRFVFDPGSDTQVLDDVSRTATLVLTEPGVRVSLAIAPRVLEEWRRVAGGYERLGPGGVERIPATDPTARRYAQALDLLVRAIETRRLELLTVPYADPDPRMLEASGLLDPPLEDLTPQLEQGTSAVFTSLESSSSGVFAFAGDCPTSKTARIASRNGAAAVLVNPKGVVWAAGSSREGTVAAGAYQTTRAPLVALVSSPTASRAAASGETSAAVKEVFERSISKDAAGALVIDVAVRADRPAVAARIGALSRAIRRQPFARMVTASQAASGAADETVTVTARPIDDGAPAGYWDDVVAARREARALADALPETDRQAESANVSSLVAQCACWAGPRADWALADRAWSFVASARRSYDNVLGKISLTVEDITLSGSEGEVPISVRNDGSKTVRVRLQVLPVGMRVVGPRVQQVELRPQDNFFVLQVDLRNTLSGQAKVAIVSGPLEVASTTVTVRASYLDRLAVIGMIVLVLGGLLAFIIRRVRAAEAADSPEQPERADRQTPRYTGSSVSDEPDTGLDTDRD